MSTLKSRAGYRPPPNLYVVKAQAAANDALTSLRTTATSHINRARTRPVEEHGITLASSFILAVSLRWLTLSKGDHLITLSLLLNVLLFSLITTLIQSHSAWAQYTSTVLFFEVMRTLHLVHTSPLLLAAAPLAIDQLKVAIVHTAQKVDVKQKL